MHARNDDFLHASRVTRPRIWTGLLLNESYRIGSLVEQGAATEIYDGTEVSTGEPVALKILLPQLAQDEKTRALFLDEARALRRLSQPGLLRYRSCARDPQSDLTYIVTDVVGMRLSSRLANRKLGEEDIVALTKRLALALAAAHGAGVIHRGLRPHAIALPQGRLSDATITDFNLIKSAHTGQSAAFDDAMVDHDFCAPEQLSNERRRRRHWSVDGCLQPRARDSVGARRQAVGCAEKGKSRSLAPADKASSGVRTDARAETVAAAPEHGRRRQADRWRAGIGPEPAQSRTVREPSAPSPHGRARDTRSGPPRRTASTPPRNRRQ